MRFTFEEHEVGTFGEIGAMCCAIAKSGDRERAKRFVDAYTADMAMRHPQAEAERIVASNIGYLSGYYSPPTMKAILEVFDASHPIFGKRTNVGDEEAFDAGAMYTLDVDPQADTQDDGT